MYARAIDDAEARLVQLRHDEWARFGLTALALGAALALTQLYRPLALPVLIGGMAVGALGVRTLWLRWDLVERLSGEQDAYVIPEVLASAARAGDLRQRRSYAASIRFWLEHSPPGCEQRVAACADVLEELARELEDDAVELGTASGVACKRLLTDPALSALFNPGLPPEDLRSSVAQIRSGLAARPRDLEGGAR